MPSKHSVRLLIFVLLYINIAEILFGNNTFKMQYTSTSCCFLELTALMLSQRPSKISCF